MTENWYWYEETAEGNIRLLRMFGTSPEVVVPENILGKKVTELGNYCFAATNKAASCQICSDGLAGEAADREFQRLTAQGKLCELCGKYLEKVILPKGMVRMGDFCFYQCSSLSELTIGSSLTEIGSDAFMNCLRLHKITVLGSVKEASGLKQILGQRSLETKVKFIVNHQTEAVLLYPEYSEYYDEIGPAHIFELNIEGEGFRARQCFQEGIVDLAQYDGVFVQACAEESIRTLCYMAGMRLYYPVGLRLENREIYENYIRNHGMQVVEILVKEKDFKLLQFFGEQGYLAKREVESGIRLAVSMNWTEGAGMLLQNQRKWFTETEKAEYSFEDF